MLTVSSHRDLELITVVPVGEIDMASVDTLATQIAAAIAGDAPCIEVDLSGVTFLDSMGIQTLLKGRRLADANAKNYTVNGAGGMVHEVLELTGVWSYLAGRP